MPAGQITPAPPPPPQRSPSPPPPSPRGSSVGWFRIGGVIGKGSHGEVRRGVDTRSGEEVAIKLCPKRGADTLRREIGVYQKMNGTPGFPNMRWSGRCAGDSAGREAIVTDLLSNSLGATTDSVGGRLKVGSVAALGRQMLAAVRALHEHKFIHRDIKPDNFLLGRDACSRRVFLIDFGLAVKFCDADGLHNAYHETGSFSGTPNFASIHQHHGVAPGRRDDLESLLYTLVWMAKGALPWEGLGGRTWQEKARRVAVRKCVVSAEQLGEGLPSAFTEFASQVRRLSFSEAPDYDYFDSLLARCCCPQSAEDSFEWEAPYEEDDEFPDIRLPRRPQFVSRL
eukprot:TRINITY_DN2077_c3_g2_i1.p1 TRINITY_DN2077_c3_g2~~TRINITY_DN2077_c3_g2_i1.p1  ORF type:complete len:369 (+),score=96.86 TRINITY_DN2077_c3_g2_i1:90-1109(+)